MGGWGRIEVTHFLLDPDAEMDNLMVPRDLPHTSLGKFVRLEHSQRTGWAYRWEWWEGDGPDCYGPDTGPRSMANHGVRVAGSD